jgi:acetyltransferase-like isoleucine patch superfamily enzyme
LETLIAPSADVSGSATIGDGCKIWHLAQVREGARLGVGCIIGRGAYVGSGVSVGAHSKIQNYALIYEPAFLEEGVFIGPAAVLTNDQFPRSINADGSLKSADDWRAEGVTVRRGAAVGARAVVLPGVEIGEWSMVGAGAVVTKDVLPYALVVGTPARQVGWVGKSGRVLHQDESRMFVDPANVERFIVQDGRLEEVQ